jgi:hypothetical protein
VVNEYRALDQPIRKLPGKRSGSTTALWNVNPPDLVETCKLKEGGPLLGIALS